MKIMHVETGNIYTLVDIIKTKGVAVVVYEDAEGTRYARDFAKWFEKFRFHDTEADHPEHITLHPYWANGKLRSPIQYFDMDGCEWVKQYGVPAKAPDDFAPHSAKEPLFKNAEGAFLDLNRIKLKPKGMK